MIKPIAVIQDFDMLKYDWLLDYPHSMIPGQTLIMSEFPDHNWCDKNLIKSTPYYQSDYTDSKQIYVCDIVGFKSTHVRDGTFAICYSDIQNYQLVLNQFPELIVEPDPFRPDPVQVIVKDGKEMSRWQHLKEVFKIK